MVLVTRFMQEDVEDILLTACRKSRSTSQRRHTGLIGRSRLLA